MYGYIYIWSMYPCLLYIYLCQPKKNPRLLRQLTHLLSCPDRILLLRWLFRLGSDLRLHLGLGILLILAEPFFKIYIYIIWYALNRKHIKWCYHPKTPIKHSVYFFQLQGYLERHYKRIASELSVKHMFICLEINILAHDLQPSLNARLCRLISTCMG